MNLKNIPSLPGCYLYKNNKDKIIYVGKAKNLKKRVSSYFLKKDHDPKTASLIEHIDDVEFIITNSEVEALILENNLIKKHKPKYNISLKDSKTYAFIKITSEDYPRLIIARKKDDKGIYYGPFISGKERDYILDFLRKTFKIPTCKKFKKKPCLRYHINMCDAPCLGNISKTEYCKRIKIIKDILGGDISRIIKNLESKMKDYAKDLEFESAQIVKNQIKSLNYLLEKQNIQRDKKYNEDVINYVIFENKVYLMIFNIYKGMLDSRVDFEFDFYENFLSDFILQYYFNSDSIPKEIIVPEIVDPSLKDALSKIANKKIRIIIPKIGAKKQLIDLVKKNIEVIKFSGLIKVFELKEALDLYKMPKVIECFDISHLSGTAMVASMVQFKDGKPNKSNYRKFKIKTVDKIDDFAAMKEVIKRRYSRLKDEGKEMPDLIIVDGGKGQLSSAAKILKELRLSIPLISLAKREEEVFSEDKKEPIILPKKSNALLLLQSIRDEAHRFAITYNRLLRSKKLLKK